MSPELLPLDISPQATRQLDVFGDITLPNVPNNPPTRSQIDGTNVSYQALDFADAATEQCFAPLTMGPGDAPTVLRAAQAIISNPDGAAGDFVMALSVRTVDAAAIDGAFPADVTTVITAPTPATNARRVDLNVPAGSVEGGILRIRRLGTDPADTAAGRLRLLGLSIQVKPA
jgi:hypothetical protein